MASKVNPFEGKLPPGYYVRLTETAGVAIYVIFDDEGRFVLATQPDELVPAEATIKYVWRWHDAVR